MKEEMIYSRVQRSARQQERARAREFIEDIKAGVANCFLLNLFAPKGFGKTVFLKQIQDDYERVLPTSLVRVGDFCGEGAEAFALCDLLIHIVRDFGQMLPQQVASLPPNYERWSDEKQLAEMVIGLVSSAKEFEKVTLLLFDNYDLMPDEERRWLEENLFSALARTRNVAVILTSELELKFTESFDLRMRLESRELSSLDPEAISRAWPEKYGEIAGEIYRITGGLPALTAEFIEQLEASQVTTPAGFRAREQKLVEKYYRTYIKEGILADFDPDLRDTMLVLALLRRFDIKVLKGILPKVLPDIYKDYETADYLDLVDRLRRQSWVQWRRGYTLNPALRMTLQEYVLAERPDLYKSVNREALTLYRELLQDEYREYYLLERLYHVFALSKFEKGYGLSFVQDKVIQAKIVDELEEYLRSKNEGKEREGQSWAEDLQTTDLDLLKSSLQQDPDLKVYAEGALRVIQDTIKTKRKSQEGNRQNWTVALKAA